MFFLIIIIITNLTSIVISSTLSVTDSITLMKYLCHGQLKSGTNLRVSSLINYKIDTKQFCMVQNISNVSISSDSLDVQVNITCRQGQNGFGFFNTTNLTIQGFTFRNCGAAIRLPINVSRVTNGSLYIGPHQRSVLFFSHCSNTTIENMNIEGDYYGFGILSINIHIQFLIKNLFLRNDAKNQHCIQTNNNFSCSGSGLAFVFLDITDNNMRLPNNKTYLIFQNINIHNVSNFYSYRDSFLNMYDELRNASPILSGTGLTVLLSTNQYSIITAVLGLNVTGSKASHVGAVLIFYYNTPLLHPNFMKNLYLKNNSISLDAKATSPAVTFLFSGRYKMKEIIKNSPDSPTTIMDSYFANNIGYKGAGMLVSASAFSHVKALVQLFNCTFIGNKVIARGSAVHIEDSIMRSRGRSLRITLSSVNAHKNSDLSGTYSASVFSFISAQAKVHFEWSNFTQNNGSVIELYSSSIELAHSFICQNNTSNKGSCIQLKGNSFIEFIENSSIILKYNRAFISGGAIYSDNIGGPSDICTILLGGNQAFITALNNSALFDGDDMKISNLYNCTIYKVNKQIFPSQDNLNVFQNFLNYHPKNPNAIVSRVSKLNVCNQNPPQATAEFNIFSGVSIQIRVVANDPGNHPVYTTATVSLHPASNSHIWSLEELNFYNLYSTTCNILNISITIDRLANKSEGFFGIQSMETSLASLIYKVTILPCPSGFDTSINVGKCQCSSFLLGLKTNITCSIQDAQIILPTSSWFGVISSSTEAFSFACPPEYCHSEIYKVGTNDSMCLYNRTGVMCGGCMDGHSVVFGSDECRQCSNIWLLTLVGYAMVGVFLVFFLFVAKLTISNGTFGGIIFVANMSAISLHTSLLSNGRYTLPIRYLIAFLNLNTGFSVCLYNGMTGISKVALQFLFPAYLCFIVLVIVVSSRFSSRLTNLIVGSAVQVLATIIHLSYANLISTVASILVSSQVLYSPDNSPHRVWYYNGNIEYFSSQHLTLFIASLLIIAIVILPYLIFTTFASNLRRYRFFNLYFRPLIDTFHGPYKDKYGYWCGVRQWLMMLLYIVFSALRGRRPGVMLMTNIVCIGLFLLIQVFLKPFKSTAHNVIESWFMFLLFTTDLVTFYFIASVKLPTVTSSVTGVVLMSLYLLSVIAVLIVQGIHQYKSNILCKAYESSKLGWLLHNVCCPSSSSSNHGNNIDYEVREPLLGTY